MAIVRPDQITSARVLRFDEYWRSKWVNDRMPSRSSIDPSELLDILPFLIIADIERNPFRVRYRLCGTMVQKYDQELAGKYLDELERDSDATKAEATEAYRRATDDREPAYVVTVYVSRTMNTAQKVQ